MNDSKETFLDILGCTYEFTEIGKSLTVPAQV